VAARQRSLTERERRLADREQRLAEKAPPPRESAGAASRALEERERVLAAREAELRKSEEALERRRKALEERERKLEEQPAMTPPESRATQEAEAPAAGGFNLEALEHALDERAAEFPERADEWRAYMIFLREFVHADGNLPSTFNSLVREVFGELL
jgi:hypothetical protein